MTVSVQKFCDSFSGSAFLLRFEVGALLKVLEFYPSGDSFETLSRQSSWLSLVRFIHFSGKGLRFVLEFPQSSR